MRNARMGDATKRNCPRYTHKKFIDMRRADAVTLCIQSAHFFKRKKQMREQKGVSFITHSDFILYAQKQDAGNAF